MSDEIRDVTVDEAAALIDDEEYAYLDVRTEGEYDGGHPVGAVNVPWMLAKPGGMQPNPDFLAVVQAAFAKSSKLVVACRSGGRSRRAILAMQDAGFSAVVDMPAGYGGKRNAFGKVTDPGWADSGKPTATTAGDGSYAQLKAQAEL